MADTKVAKKDSFSGALSLKLDEVSNALPKDFNKERFVQNCLALVNENPALQKYSQAKLMAGMLKASYLGVDFMNREAYLIPYGQELNFQTSYIGSCKIAKKYAIRPIKEISSKLVREGDDFQEIVEDGTEKFIFKPKAFNSGEVIGVFAYVVYEDGGQKVEVMTKDDVEAVRAMSKAKNSPAWSNPTSWGEMARKTVLRRLCKHIEIDFENPNQREIFNEDTDIDFSTEARVEAEIESNANSVDFEEYVDAEVKEVVEN